jgi:nicotinate-nucleotide adenylyltransferase
MVKKNTRIGLFGGSFNPVHYGHLVIAESIRETFDLDKVIFIPCHIPPHKDSCVYAPKRHRLRMLQMATRNNPAFTVSSFELAKKSVSYSVDTIHHFRRFYKKNELFFIIGADSLTNISRWRDYKKLTKKVNIVVAPRKGSRPKSVHIRAHVAEIPCVSISSSGIRRKIHEGKDISLLVPRDVEHYIATHRVYRRHG